jgi:hypothetical protein
MAHIKKIIQYLRNKPLDCVLILIFTLAIVKLYSLYFSVSVDDGNWEQFKIEHHCKLLKNERGTKKLSWECDDGEVYFRWMQQR